MSTFRVAVWSGVVCCGLILASAAGGGQARVAAAGPSGTVNVSAKANIFSAGSTQVQAPAGGGGGVLPVEIDFAPGTGHVLTFSSVTGSVGCCGSGATGGPAGGSGTTDIPAVGGISGVKYGSQLFLAGVFLGPAAPTGSPPPTKTATTAPAVGQVFFVGAGRTAVTVPARATRLFLGFADAYAFVGPAGYYDDNSGSVRATYSIGGPAAPTTVGFVHPWLLFSGAPYDNPVARSYPQAGGTVMVPGVAGAKCLIGAYGLKSGQGYAVYLDANGLKKGVATSAGPWVDLGHFTAVAGKGSYKCSTAPPSHAAFAINEASSNTTILLSQNLP